MKKILKIILNLVIFLVVTGFIWYIVRSLGNGERLFAERNQKTSFTGPYRKDISFKLPYEINRFELHDGQLFISAGNEVFIYDTAGKRLASFPVKEEVRDITVEKGQIYVLYPTFIEVYNTVGQLQLEWEACSPLSDYCSFALAGDYVFVTDAVNKNICKYTKDGDFVTFIQSPKGFIIPSYSFDIESRNDTLYCINSGRHLIETYTLDGQFITAFGHSGSEDGYFAGCCNPSYLSFTPDGYLLTSEKGNPRISSFEHNGLFREILLNSRLMGGGSNAYKVRADENRLFIAGKNAMTIFNYDSNRQVINCQSTCADCANCPLRTL